MSQRGSALLMTMVLLGMFMVMMVAGVGLINTQFHQTTDQEQEEKAFGVADAGVHYALWLLTGANVDPASLNNQTVVREVTDPINENNAGHFFLFFTVATVGGWHEITVLSTGLDPVGKKWQTVEAKIQEYDVGGGATSYSIKSWDHKP